MRGRHLVTDLRRARREGRAAAARLDEAERELVASILRDGNIKTLDCVYSARYDEGAGRFRLVERPAPFHGLPGEDS